jgi:thioredoxin-like negative regulator of GroEL
MGDSIAVDDQKTVVETFLGKAQQAAQEGQEQEARAWLEGVVELDAENVEAWLALASLIPDPRERMLCYANILQLSPGNPEAKAGLRQTRRQL